MSIENFTSAYPADETFVPSFSRRPEYGLVSPVRLVAQAYIREGADGLSNYEMYLKAAQARGDNAIIQRATYFRDLNQSAVQLGVTVLAIEGILSNGYLDQETFNAHMDEAYRASPLKPKLFLNPEDVTLTEEERKAIVDAAKKDKTFGIFFDKDLKNLPLSLRTALRGTELIRLRDEIVPGFTQRVGLIIEARKAATPVRI